MSDWWNNTFSWKNLHLLTSACMKMLPLCYLAQSQHEMFIMRKNHLDFKAVAQALAMDKDKLGDYIMVSLLHTPSYNSLTWSVPVAWSCLHMGKRHSVSKKKVIANVPVQNDCTIVGLKSWWKYEEQRYYFSIYELLRRNQFD